MAQAGGGRADRWDERFGVDVQRIPDVLDQTDRMTPAQQPESPARFPGVFFDVVALAASAGVLQALTRVLSGLTGSFPAAILIVQHLDPRHRSLLAEVLGRRTALKVKQAEEGDR